MKKILLFASAVMVCAAVSAQEYALIDTTAAGITSAGTALTAGTVMAQSTNVVMKAAFDDTYKANSAAANDFVSISFGETEIALTSGAQGATNPKDGDGGNPCNTLVAPVSGAAYQLEVSVDGYLYVINKMTSNKQYFVFEEGSPIGYKASMQTNGDLGVITVEVKGEGEYNYVSESIKKVEVIAGAEEDSYKQSGTGVICFPAFAGCKYLVGAAGSKMMAGGFFFAPSAVSSIVLKGDGIQANLFQAAAINTVNSSAEVVSSRYFLPSGQEVAAPQAGNRGLYIVRNVMSDGSVNVSKMILK